MYKLINNPVKKILRINMQNYIKKLISKSNLTYEESYFAAKHLLEGITDAEKGAFLVLLSAKGEVSDELLGVIKAIKEKSHEIKTNCEVLDIVGTGGDYSNTYNISTASALLVSACGVPVIKHGNRAVSSSCGSADVLEALGYNFNLNSSQILDKVIKDNFAFCFAPNFHPIFAKLRKLRKDLKVPTILNLLGPLLNPANPQYLLLGVNDKKNMQLIAEVLFKLGTKRSLVVHGNNLDELSCMGVSHAILVTTNGLTNLVINPEDYGFKLCSLSDLQGGNIIVNSKMLTKTLSGERTTLTDTVIFNAGVGLYLYGKANSINDGVKIAQERLIQGNIIKPNKLQQIISRKRNDLLVNTKKSKSLKNALLVNPGAVICEIKRASPSIGKIIEINDIESRAKEYVNIGARAISVLTDEGFSGSMEDLKLVARELKDTNIPILCKDFIFTAKQIAEAANAGADAILLIVAVLGNEIANLVKIAHDFGLETVVEIHNSNELQLALDSDTDIIGVNQRNLNDFSMHPEIFAKIIDKLPKNIIKIAESGITSYIDAKNLFLMGYDAVLVGEAFSKLQNPKDFFTDES